MTRLFDRFGWATEDQQYADRVATAPAPSHGDPVEGQPFPNWTGYEWVMLDYATPEPEPAPGPPPPPPEPEWAWFIDLGPFADRLGAASVAIDLSTEPGVVVIRNDFSRRKWIDLKDPRVIAALWYLAGHAHPVLGTLAAPLLTPAAVTTILTTPVPLKDNLALRKVYFS